MLNSKQFNELFPTKMAFVVFISYMALFINQGLLVTATKNKDNKFDYNPITVVLMTETLKLLIALGIYLQSNSVGKLIRDIEQNKNIMLKYFVPSFLYCVYNNLTFINLTSYDPTTYFLLLQFRVVVTGVVFQFLFKKILSRIQWVSLILLTFGCIVKQMGHATKNDKKSVQSAEEDFTKYINTGLLLILVQVFASCFAGVYNEFLLKEKNNNVDIMLQNAFMYIDSIVCNVLLLQFYVPSSQSTGGVMEALSFKALSAVFHWKVMLIMLNNAMIGIVTSLFLKSLNSILKAFASALELMFTGILSWIFFGIPLDILTVFSIGIVSLATWLYSQNPVQNPAPVQTAEDKESLIEGKSSESNV